MRFSALEQALRRHLSASGPAFTAVARNRDLRLLSLALTGSCVGHWSYVVAVSVYAYHAGGTRVAAVVSLVRMIPAAAASPFSSMLGDRFPRVAVLVATDLVRASLMLAAALAIWSGAPQAVAFCLAALVSLAATPAEPAFAGLMPQLATTPAEPTAANVASSAIQSVGFFAGPALGAMLALAGPAAAIVVTSGLVLWSAALTSRSGRVSGGRVRLRRRHRRRRARRRRACDPQRSHAHAPRRPADGDNARRRGARGLRRRHLAGDDRARQRRRSATWMRRSASALSSARCCRP